MIGLHLSGIPEPLRALAKPAEAHSANHDDAVRLLRQRLAESADLREECRRMLPHLEDPSRSTVCALLVDVEAERGRR